MKCVNYTQILKQKVVILSKKVLLTFIEKQRKGDRLLKPLTGHIQTLWETVCDTYIFFIWERMQTFIAVEVLYLWVELCEKEQGSQLHTGIKETRWVAPLQGMNAISAQRVFLCVFALQVFCFIRRAPFKCSLSTSNLYSV